MTQADHPERAPPMPRIPPEPDGDKAQAAFDAKAQQWDVYSRAPLGRLRCDLTLHYLGRHLQDRQPVIGHTIASPSISQG